jgi:hypothetical protein
MPAGGPDARHGEKTAGKDGRIWIPGPCESNILRQLSIWSESDFRMKVLPVLDFEEYLLTWVSTVRNHENL